MSVIHAAIRAGDTSDGRSDAGSATPSSLASSSATRSCSSSSSVGIGVTGRAVEGRAGPPNQRRARSPNEPMRTTVPAARRRSAGSGDGVPPSGALPSEHARRRRPRPRHRAPGAGVGRERGPALRGSARRRCRRSRRSSAQRPPSSWSSRRARPIAILRRTVSRRSRAAGIPDALPGSAGSRVHPRG